MHKKALVAAKIIGDIRPDDILVPTRSAEKANVPKPEELMKKTPTPKAKLKAMAKPPEVAPERKWPSEISFGNSLGDIIYHV